MSNLLKALSLIFILIGCGRDDKDRQQCVIYGDNCSPENQTEESESNPTDYSSRQGPKGDTGRTGSDGLDGQSCSVTTTDVGAVITCEDGSSSVILNGLKGEQGPAAELNIYPVYPCPYLDGSYPEVLLCIEDSLYAVFDGGPQKDRLILVTPGNYRTTDNRQCEFTVIEGCNLEYNLE